MIPQVLIVDAEARTRDQTCSALRAEGIGRVTTLGDHGALRPYLAGNPCDLLLLDLGAADQPGIALIGELIAAHPAITVIAMSHVDDTAVAVSCIQQGAYDYLVKPLSAATVANVVRRTLGMQRARAAPTSARHGDDDALAAIVTGDPVMRGIFDYLRTIAPSGQPVLILGETGTGKDLIAQALHRLSGRKGEYVPVNLAGLDAGIIDDSLFGHRAGAFTGATGVRPGLILRASAGTLFLDEIGDLDPVSQVKLLRLMQDGEYYPLGSDLPKHSTARIVAATNIGLRHLRDQGRLRKDLFYRLGTHIVELPPLRERAGDLIRLVDHFVNRAMAELGKTLLPNPGLHALMSDYPFPGNIRELRSLVYDAACRTEDGMPLSLLPFRRARDAPSGNDHVPASGGEHGTMRFPDQLPTAAAMQDLLMAEALRRSRGNQAQAATQLGITRQALNKRLGRQLEYDPHHVPVAEDKV